MNLDTLVKNQLADKRWIAYCKEMQKDPNTTPSVDQAAGFVGYLSTITTINAWQTYKGMIDGVKANFEFKGVSTKAFYDRKFERVTTGLQRRINQAASTKKPSYRAFCTPELLQSILPKFRSKTVGQRNAQRCTVIATSSAFRLGELVSTKHNKGKVPRRKHVQEKGPDEVSVLLAESKTDRYHKGVVKSVKNEGLLRGASAVRQCLAEAFEGASSDTPLVCDVQGRALTADEVMAELHHALRMAGHSTKGYTTKCFRRGSTKSLARKGGTKKQIRKLGGWSKRSNSYKTYIESDDSDSDNALISAKSKPKKGWHIVQHDPSIRLRLRKGVHSN